MVIDEAAEHAEGNKPHSDAGELAITPVAMQFRQAGQVGLALGPDGRYYVLRAAKVEVAYQPWSSELRYRVKNKITRERKEQVLRELEQQLRNGVSISVRRAALHRIPVPK